MNIELFVATTFFFLVGISCATYNLVAQVEHKKITKTECLLQMILIMSMTMVWGLGPLAMCLEVLAAK